MKGIFQRFLVLPLYGFGGGGQLEVALGYPEVHACEEAEAFAGSHALVAKPAEAELLLI